MKQLVPKSRHSERVLMKESINRYTDFRLRFPNFSIPLAYISSMPGINLSRERLTVPGIDCCDEINRLGLGSSEKVLKIDLGLPSTGRKTGRL